jgi:hypothetical protein
MEDDKYLDDDDDEKINNKNLDINLIIIRIIKIKYPWISYETELRDGKNLLLNSIQLKKSRSKYMNADRYGKY